MFPSRKSHRIKYDTAYGSIVISFDQATIEETNALLKTRSAMGFAERFYDFFEKSTYEPLKIKHRVFKKYFKLKALNVIVGNMDVIQADVYEKMFNKYKSIYHEVNTSYDGKPLSRKSLEGTEIMDICKEFNIGGPRELVENYTYEQYEWMFDRLLFRGYEYDKKSQVVNDRALGGADIALSVEEKSMLDIIKEQRKKGAFEDRENSTFIVEKG